MSQAILIDNEASATTSMDEAARLPDLGRRAARGGAIVLASTGANRALNLAITAVLARMLTPAEYGQLGMVLTLTFIIGVFNDMGLTTATIQKANLQQGEASAAFWLNLLFGCIMFAVTASLAPALAAFYHVPALRNLTMLCGLCFPIAATGSQHLAMMVRRLQFQRVAACELTGVVAGGIVGILMARAGFGVQALAGQMIGMSIATSAMSWMLSRWRPSLPQRHSGVDGILKFGGYLTGFNLLNYLSRNLDNVLVGRFCGSETLGLYTRAYSLMLYPIGLVSGPLARVALPTLSQFQSDHARMRGAYLRILTIIGFITFPMMTLLFASAHDVIAVIYGNKWADAVPLFRILCIAGIYQGVYSAAGQVFAASGRTDRMLRAGLVNATLLSTAFFTGVRWGAMGVAWSYVAVSSIYILPYLRYAYATIGQRLAEVLRVLAPSFASSLLMGLCCILIQGTVARNWQPLVRLSAISVLAACVYFSALLILWPRLLHQTLLQIIGSMFPIKGAAAARSPIDAGRARSASIGNRQLEIVHIVHHEGLSPIFEPMVVAPMAHLMEQGFKTRLVILSPIGEFIRPGLHRRWRERMRAIRQVYAGPVHRLPTPPARARRLWSDSRVFTRWADRNLDTDKPLILHCRGPQATLLAIATRHRRPNARIVFDMRGLSHAEYLYDAGFNDISDAPPAIAQKAQKHFDRDFRAAEQADGVICVSGSMADYIRQAMNLSRKNILIAPNSSDVAHIQGMLDQRSRVRRLLGLESRFVVLYSGSLYRRQCPEAGLSFFQMIKSIEPSAHYLVLTREIKKMRELATARGLTTTDCTTLSVEHRQVPAYLSAADMGFITTGLLDRPSLANAVCCPVKFAEYLVAGLPVLMSSGIGDCSFITQRNDVGVVISPGESADTHQRRLRNWLAAYQSNREAVQDRCRALAGAELSLTAHREAMQRLYTVLARQSSDRTHAN